MKYSIDLDSKQPVYYSGQTISGRVNLDPTEEITRVRCITIAFRGWAKVRWSEGSGKDRRTYWSQEEYFNLIMPIYGQIKNDNTTDLPRGHHSYPFQFVVPHDIPSSYQSIIGNVVYSLTSNIDRAWGFDKKTVTYVTIHRPLDLNMVPNIMDRAEGSASKNLCCLCCKSGPIEGTLRIERRGYVPGDTIVFNGQIENHSSRVISDSKALLVMTVMYVANKVKTVEHILAEIKHKEEIPVGGSHNFTNEKFLIPAVPPSYLDKCNIIIIAYFVRLVANPAGPAIDLKVPVEIVVGDIPLKNVAEGYGMDTSMLLPSQALATPDNLYESNARSAIPQASFAESPFSRPFETETDENTFGQTDFTPVYSYYKWDQTNPADRFRV